MKYLYLWFTAALTCTGVASALCAEKQEGNVPSAVILFERPIGDAGQKLVVVRGPDREPSLIGFWKDKSIRDSTGLTGVEQIGNVYEVRAELQSPDTEPLVLASHLRIENKVSKTDRGVVVLDALVEPGFIVLATAEGPFLALWQIGGGTGTCWTVLRADKPWALAAAAYRLDDKLVGIKLGRTKDRRLSLEVTEKLSGQHTIYEEIEKVPLQFKLIRQKVK